MLYLERIARLDPQLNAFRKVMAERALVDAQQADGRKGAGEERPLLGVPIAVKDVEDVTGEVTRWGTAANFTQAAARTASSCGGCAARARSSSARPTRPSSRSWATPRDRRSGSRATRGTPIAARAARAAGAAAAVAAGLCAAATASDGAGLDPHPGVELRPRRPEADARPHPARSPEGALVRDERRWASRRAASRTPRC